MSRLKDFYISEPDYVDLKADNSIDPYAVNVCKSCKKKITIEDREEETNGRSVDFQVELGHDGMCDDKTKEKIINGKGGVN